MGLAETRPAGAAPVAAPVRGAGYGECRECDEERVTVSDSDFMRRPSAVCDVALY